MRRGLDNDLHSVVRALPDLAPSPSPPAFEDLAHSADLISYDKLYRHAEEHGGELVVCREAQVSSTDDRLIVGVGCGIFFCPDDIEPLSYDGERLRRGDKVGFVGVMLGLVEYGFDQVPQMTVVELRRTFE